MPMNVLFENPSSLSLFNVSLGGGPTNGNGCAKTFPRKCDIAPLELFKTVKMFEKALANLETLKKNLECCICHGLVKDAVVRGSCDHFSCRNCIESFKEQFCPACNVPALSLELKKYDSVNSAVQYYLDLKELLNSGPEAFKENNELSNSEKSTRKCLRKQSNEGNTTCISSVKNSSASKSSNKRVSNPLTHRNMKGETPLQVASIKGKVEEVTRLLNLGADPNAKDNAGWTPLHEACSRGFINIAQLLLENGANVNATGLEEIAPLHDAVVKGSVELVNLLLSYGADKTMKTTKSLTPLNLASDGDVKAILQSDVIQISPIIKKDQEAGRKLILLGTGLNDCHKVQLEKCAKLLDAKITNDFSENVTHLIAADGGLRKCPRTLKFLHAVLMGCWILSPDWLDICISQGRFIQEDLYEISGTLLLPKFNGAKRGRENASEKKPSLFSGCFFHFFGKFAHPSPPKSELIRLVKRAGGEVLEDMPVEDSPSLNNEPFHLKPESKLATYPYFIIYNEHGSSLRKLPQHYFTKSLSVSWFLDCIAKFEISDP